MSDGFLLNPQEQPTVPPQETPPAPVEDESSVAADEKAFEQLPETRDAFLEQALEIEVPPTNASAAGAAPSPTIVTPPVPKDEVQIEVEKILEEGLGDYFQNLSPAVKARFQKKGEDVAIEISGMVRSLHVQVKRVLRLVRDWLMTIPGVNKFFLEQEAKIKTDRIVELERERREPNPLP